ncbi:MAG: hypothetical protein KDB03_00700 [Planctomycetales bacterium]|nr:hypothetical protein [Planctomycetales bacterium]
MLILKIRKAEIALRSGRLDEAYEQANLSGLREHYRGQKLVSALVPAFVTRGKKHLENHNPSGALRDFEKAQHLGGNLEELGPLISIAVSELKGERDNREQQRLQVQHARDLMQAGAKTLCQVACHNRDVDLATQRDLIAELERNEQAIESQLKPIQTALNSGKLGMAMELMLKLHGGHAKHRAVQSLLAELWAAIGKHLNTLWQQGRFEQASSFYAQARNLPNQDLEVIELASRVEQLQQAAGQLWDIDGQALLRRLKSCQLPLGSANWLATAITSATHLVAALEDLKNGPLAQFEPRTDLAASTVGWTVDQNPIRKMTPVALKKIPSERASEQPDSRLSNPALQLNVDEAGSFTIFQQPQITLGKESRTRPVDVAFASQSELPQVRIVRSDEDYFLYADRLLEINQRQVTDKLLAHGDRIRLADRISFRFRRPHPGSSTAILELSTSTRQAGSHSRHIILIGDVVVLGPHKDAHIRVPSAEGRAVVSEKNGQLFIAGQSLIEAHPLRQDERPLIPGQAIAVNSIRVVVVPVVS